MSDQKQGKKLDQIRSQIKPGLACYVLITCTEPSKEGKMEVELHYEGDEDLASFLVENAGQVFEDRKRMTSC